MSAPYNWNIKLKKRFSQVGPEKLIDPMKEHRKIVAQELHNKYRLKWDNFLKNTATGNKSWVHHYNPENKRQSME